MAPPVKKLLKLSRNQGQKLEKISSPLDDSMDDFIVSRPLRNERKTSKNNLGSVSKTTDSSEIGINGSSVNSTNDTKEPDNRENQSKINKTQSNSAESSTNFKEGEANNDENSAHTSSPNPLQHQIRKVVEKRRTTRRKQATDESDLSLALALSESLQSANESARRHEEDILLTENCAEAISSLREEEQATGILNQVFQKPDDVPVTKVKRKAKATSKKEPRLYTLALRSQSERERLIAERAASILTQEQEDPLKPPKTNSTPSSPASEYLRQFSKNEKPLWERAALSDAAHSNESKDFYVDTFRSILSPPKKKSGYTNILLHLSQLPGRGCSQIEKERISDTQILLEELACGAEGGFMDESCQQGDGHVTLAPLSNSVSQLVEDWSGLLDSSLLSDVIIRTSDKTIQAHRLVLTVRSPRISAEIKKSNHDSKDVLDWSKFSSSSALRVLRFVYAASYEHDGRDESQVRRLARRYEMNELIELLPASVDEDYSSSDESGLEDKPESKPVDKEVLSITVDESSSHSEISVIQETSSNKNPPGDNILRKGTSPSKDEISVLDEIENVSMAGIHNGGGNDNHRSFINDGAENSVRGGTSIVKQSQPASTGVMSSSDMEISNNVTSNDREVPLSPDMFEEAPSDSDEEEVIDLTQEGCSDGCPSVASCQEMAANTGNNSDGDVSMLECSVISSLENRPQKSPSKSTVQETRLDEPAASCSRYDVSWSDYPVADNHFPDYCPSPANDRTLPGVDQEKSNKSSEVNDFPDELDSIFPQEVDPSPQRPTLFVSSVEDMNTPDPPRLAKKRKIEVTPLPDYQSMETPLLKKELNKFGLKPVFKRKQAVKLLHHIYEELHPLVTDTESSFQDTPDRPAATTRRQRSQSAHSAASPTKSSRDLSSFDESESGQSQEDEESMIVMEMDRDDAIALDSPTKSVPLKERMKMFFKSRPDIYEKVLTFEPIPFENLVKEIRKAGIKCKAQALLDFLDEECITCQMKSRNRNRPKPTEDDISPSKVGKSPAKVAKSPAKKLPTAKGRRVAKKLIS